MNYRFSLVLIFLFPFFGCQHHCTPETIIIPYKLDGFFAVVYGENCGIDPPIKDGKRLLTIPESGVLILKSEFESGIVDETYYFEDSSGGKHLMPASIPPKTIHQGVERSGTSVSTPDNRSKDITYNLYKIQRYLDAGKKNSIDAEEKLNEVVDSIVEACR